MKERIEEAVSGALGTLLRADAHLLTADVNERSITHRLASYLETYFPGWNVDCEYNRNHDDPKRLPIVRKNVISDDIQATTVFPDVIVHRRGTDSNLLVIEIKKTSNRESDDYDLQKLTAFKTALNYQYAAFIRLRTGPEVGIETLKWV